MEFKLEHYKQFKRNLKEIASRFCLDPDNLKVEFYTPNCQAILVEQVQDQNVKIHINLEEDRIVSIQPMNKAVNGFPEKWREKYRPFMK